ncbi:transcription termination factor 4, mitochondrial isoform X2 [Hippopotamus amphibius kiboko]|uniref:transcription termination factor 4, mitochondrial isoform X2 n=1 Tax=Hippopotamus amphibius kiboko TaxID=575201 RepID=UPI00259874FD|nr:transcription termination factor 4, mitochondrial isoform X2 [Hippopotamus amphibius kiboko]
MAALGRQVFDWHRRIALTWALIARQTPQLGEQKRTTAFFLRTLTTASNGGGLEKSSFVEPQKCAQEPEHRTGLIQCLLEKQRTPVEREKIVSSLLDMGFSDVHVHELFSIQPGKLKRVLYCCPEIFTMRQRDIEVIVGVLKEKCLFTVKQVTEILHRCPYVLREDPGELEYKFQYAYFRMGIKHVDVVRTDFLQYSMTKTKQRHLFLERLGRYQTPDKKGQTQVSNPLLKDILRVSEAEFLARTACSSAEEFEVFKKLLAREEEESEGCMADEESLEEEEEQELEEEEQEL